jgi:hypothetical protein
MIFQEFPKWKYHATKDAVIVSNPDEESALGDDWADTPAAFSGNDVAKPEPLTIKTTKKVK